MLGRYGTPTQRTSTPPIQYQQKKELWLRTIKSEMPL